MCKLSKLEYNITIKLKITGDFEDLENLKDGREFATDLCNMICDEATETNKTVIYDILESELNIT